MKRILLVSALAVAAAALALGQSTGHAPDHGFFSIADIKWG